jgi:membrane protease YdiL (CAAX protease family)
MARRPSPRDERFAALAVAVWMACAAFSGRAGIWGSLGGAAVALGAGALILRWRSLAGLLAVRPGPLLTGALAGTAMTALTHALYPLVSRSAVRVSAWTADLYVAFATLTPLTAALALVPVVIGEEVVWRGVVHTAIAGRCGASATVVLGAAAYALAMAPTGSPVLVLAAFACGIVWGALRASTGSLLAPLVAHLLWDALVLFAYPLVNRAAGGS